MDTSPTTTPAPLGRGAVHPNLTFERVFEAATDDQFAGFCTACGAEADSIEEDARECTCEQCGADQVYGAAQMILENLYHTRPQRPAATD